MPRFERFFSLDIMPQKKCMLLGNTYFLNEKVFHLLLERFCCISRSFRRFFLLCAPCTVQRQKGNSFQRDIMGEKVYMMYVHDFGGLIAVSSKTWIKSINHLVAVRETYTPWQMTIAAEDDDGVAEHCDGYSANAFPVPVSIHFRRHEKRRKTPGAFI